MSLSTMKMNARQYLALGEDPPGVHLELIDGEILVSPSPAYNHGYTVTQLSHILLGYIMEHDLGELVADIDTILDELDVCRPDIIFIAKRQLALLDDSVHGIRFPPDLCVEVLSPSSIHIDRKTKFKLYRKNRVPHYWLVDPMKRTFEAFKLQAGRYVKRASGKGDDVVSAPPFPKLKIPLARLWPPDRSK